MAEANNQTETILEDDNQTNETGHEQNPNKSRVNHDTKAEKPMVYRNYGSVTVKPLLLTNHHWSTKDIKERLSSTAQSSNVTVTQHNSMLAQGKYSSVEENLFKRQDSIISQHREPAVDSTPDNCDVKPFEVDKSLITSNSEINYEISGEEKDGACDNSEKSIGIADVAAEINITCESSCGVNAESVNDQTKFSMTLVEPCTENSTENTKVALNQTADIQCDTVVDTENINSEEGYANVLECNSGIEEMPAVKHSDDEVENNMDSYETVQVQINLNNNEESVSVEQANNYTVNESASTNDGGPTGEARQLNNEADERRDENIEVGNNAEGAESIDEEQNNENTANLQVAEQESDNAENVEQNGTENHTNDVKEKEDEGEAWTQEDIQALLRKAINLHASEKDLKIILKCGGNVNKPIKSGLYPLHYAAYTDYPKCIEVLLNFGANVNVTDDIGYTPLHLAARRGNHRSMETLIENGAIINYCEAGVEIHQTEETNKLGYTTMEPINLAVQNGHPKCARLLLEKGARPNNKYFMGYEVCLAPLENPECLELLLEFGADPNVFNRCGLSPLMKACKDHHIEAVRKLIKHGADVNAICPPLFEQKSVLQFAISSGNIVIINILLGKGAKLPRQGEYRYSALHTAIMKGRADICRLLLQHGADPNEKAEEGATPMMLACSTPELIERREIIQLLLDCGADINAYSPSYSYFDPYLAPLTEYFKCIGKKEGFGIVRLMIRNGAIINFCSSGLDMEMKRLRDPYSIVPYVQCLQDNQPMFEFVVSAAAKYSPLIIYATQNIPEDMKDYLIYTATRPRNLKHLVRATLRSHLTPGLPGKVEELPLPPLLKSYLLFR